MTFDELSERLRVVDGIIPRDVILAALQRGEDAEVSLKWWKTVTAGISAFAFACFLTTLFIYHTAVPRLLDLSAYQARCVSPGIANEVMDLSSFTADVNAECVALHRDNYALFNAFLTINDSQVAQEMCLNHLVSPHEALPGRRIATSSRVPASSLTEIR